MQNERRVTADGRILEKLPNGTIVEVGRQGGQGVVLPPAPTAQYEAPQAAANVEETQTNITGKELTNEKTALELEREKRAQAMRELNSAFRTSAVLNAIRQARQIARTEGGVGFPSGGLAGVPFTTANKLKTELAPVLSRLTLEELQRMRAESPTGGAVGNASDKDMELLGSAVSSLAQTVDMPTFMRRLDAIERNFISMQINALGIDAQSEEGRALAKASPEQGGFGYTGTFDDEAPQSDSKLGEQDAKTTQDPFPEEYQREHIRYLRDNWGKLDENYLRFRVGMDEQFGFAPDLQGYQDQISKLNDFANQGGSPDQLSGLVSPERQMSAFEQGLNYAAQTPVGAGAASMGNAFAMGIPGRMAGQDNLELLREARPLSTFIGEGIGTATGSLAMGGVGRAAAAPMLMRGTGADAVHGTVYGATQDEDPLRGAALGLAGALAGDYLGRQIGNAIPNAPLIGSRRELNEAADSVPTVQELRDQAANEFDEVYRQGVAATPDQTERLADTTRMALANRGRVGGTGQTIIQDGPTRQAFDLIESFRGVEMSPRQAQTVRETIAEGTMSPVAKERAIAARMIEDFDNWSSTVMPGADKARETASRYLRGEQIERMTERGIRQGRRQKGGDEGDRLRTVFGQLQDRVEEGAMSFTPATQEAIAKVAEGDRVTNALRWAGKFGGSNPITLAGGGGLGAMGATGLGLDPVTGGILGAAITASGSAARSGHTARTIRAADEAGLLALGGDEYMQLLDAARELARRRSGNFFGGLASGYTSAYGRSDPSQE